MLRMHEENQLVIIYTEEGFYPGLNLFEEGAKQYLMAIRGSGGFFHDSITHFKPQYDLQTGPCFGQDVVVGVGPSDDLREGVSTQLGGCFKCSSSNPLVERRDWRLLELVVLQLQKQNTDE
jgi:hypothetical protein